MYNVHDSSDMEKLIRYLIALYYEKDNTVSFIQIPIFSFFDGVKIRLKAK